MNANGVRFRPCLEELEDRTVPSGNVTALVFDGVLYVGGDAAANRFEIDGQASRSASIKPLDSDTTINGQHGSILFYGIQKGYHIVTEAGDDTVILKGLDAHDTINVYAGPGNDNLQLLGVHAGKGSIIDMGDGNDQVTVQNSLFGKLYSLTAGNGDDSLVATGNTFKSTALFNGGSGTNSIVMSGNNFRHFATGGFSAPLPDTTAPTATFFTTATSPSLPAAIPFTVNFSEPVNGFTQAGLAINNGTASNFVRVSASTYTFTVAPTVDGTVTVSVPAGSATDQSPELPI